MDGRLPDQTGHDNVLPDRTFIRSATAPRQALDPRRTCLLSGTNSANPRMHQTGPAQGMEVRRPLGPVDVLVLSAWCGLAGGLLEVLTRFLCRYIDPTNRLYTLSRHFIWLVPLSNLLLFAGVGLLLALAVKFWPRRGARLMTRFIGFWVVLPALMIAGPRIYPAAWVIVAAGAGSLMAPFSSGARQRGGGG